MNRRTIVAPNLRFVLKVAQRYRWSGSKMSDLVRAGNIGLMRAARTFDPEKGLRFVSYAVWSIRASIQNYIVESRALVQFGTTRAQRRLFFALGRTRRELETPQATGAESALNEVAQDHQLAAEEARTAMETRIREALARLGDRERFIIEHRVMTDDPVTLADVGAQLGLGRERTRRLEVRAKQRLRCELRELATEIDWPFDEPAADRAAALEA
jgi:RNA polymerase sigma-32 factor